MSRGLIVEWRFQSAVFNQGVIAGCSPEVHGLHFGFTLSSVIDPGLMQMLANTPQFQRDPDCAEGPNPRWVSFDVNGVFATNIFRLFP